MQFVLVVHIPQLWLLQTLVASLQSAAAWQLPVMQAFPSQMVPG